MNCPVHIQPCDCREHQIAVLIKAALDAAMELDYLKNEPSVTNDARESAMAIIDRLYAACEVLQS